MPKYLDFQTSDNGHILVEVDEKEIPAGVEKAGLRDMVGKAVAAAQTLFDSAIQVAVQVNVETFYQAIQRLPHPPSDVEITFGLKATGELGNIAISKLGAESNYTVKLSWKSNHIAGKP